MRVFLRQKTSALCKICSILSSQPLSPCHRFLKISARSTLLTSALFKTYSPLAFRILPQPSQPKSKQKSKNSRLLNASPLPFKPSHRNSLTSQKSMSTISIPCKISSRPTHSESEMFWAAQTRPTKSKSQPR